MRSKLFNNWQTEILRPLLVSVLTAGALFGLALLFKPALHWLFAPDTIQEYPLICIAEPYTGAEPTEKRVDFFIINRTGEEYNRAKLEEILRRYNPDPSRLLFPDLKLPALPGYTLVSVTSDDAFNEDKAQVVVNKTAGDTLEFRIHHVERRAIWKATAVYRSALPATATVKRAYKSELPFTTEILERCYQG